ncbi:hypothetical protein GDO78_006986 [Eleutherodactylus coqui]|uniref:Ribosomal protein eL8/eL30/eS12/Gadd45 domain-containing protein n=1 Tax=Eleutherodactylus coqui TaxID=57060 RepID=A0A8J6KCQ8_ELECQ|nr:hypothetical protein GDO78_006986 [Eleutherodactylus coqui]
MCKYLLSSHTPITHANTSMPTLRPTSCTTKLFLLFSPFSRDPDNVTFCILAADEIDEGDIALQIHFTLIQAFCCENDINIVRLNDTEKLAEILGSTDDSGEPKDLHCILITNPSEDAWKDPALEKLGLFCEESRNVNDWVPSITLPE